jgi:hypothetical protein
MAKVTFGGGVSSFQGSIAGNTFTRTKGGSAIRNKVKPNNPATPRQMEVRNQLKQTSTAWRALTEDQRKAWTAWGKEINAKGVCGNMIQTTGFQAFTKVNLNAIQFRWGTYEVPPPVQNSEFVADFYGAEANFVMDVPTLSIQIPLGAGAAEGMLWKVDMSGPFGAGQKRTAKQCKDIFGGELDAGDITTGYVGGPTDLFFSTFGTMEGTVGKKWTAACYQYSAGLFSVPKMMSTIVT